MTKEIREALVLGLLVAVTVGCTDEDDRVAKLAIMAADRQAAQNLELIQLNRAVTEGTRQLVTAEGNARLQFTALQREFQEQQRAITEQLTQLENERRSIADVRVREPLLDAVVTGISSLLIASLPLGLVIYLLHRGRSDSVDPIVLNELLIEEIVSSRPALLPTPISAPGNNSPIANRIGTVTAEHPP